MTARGAHIFAHRVTAQWRMRVARAIVGATALLYGCSNDDGSFVTGPASYTSSFGPPIVSPDSAKVNTPVEVTVVAGGSSSCARPGGARVQVFGNVARIEMFMQYRDGVCTSDLQRNTEMVSVRFATTGVKTLRLIGTLRYTGVGSPLDSVQRPIVITP